MFPIPRPWPLRVRQGGLLLRAWRALVLQLLELELLELLELEPQGLHPLGLRPPALRPLARKGGTVAGRERL